MLLNIRINQNKKPPDTFARCKRHWKAGFQPAANGVEIFKDVREDIRAAE